MVVAQEVEQPVRQQVSHLRLGGSPRLLCLVSLTGIPPTAGFIAKVYIFDAAVQSDLVWLVIVGVLNSVVSAYYYLRVVLQMYAEEPASEERVAAGPAAGRGLPRAPQHARGAPPQPRRPPRRAEGRRDADIDARRCESALLRGHAGMLARRRRNLQGGDGRG